MPEFDAFALGGGVMASEVETLEWYAEAPSAEPLRGSCRVFGDLELVGDIGYNETFGRSSK